MSRLFCFGLGYSAMALARRVAAEGWGVAGTMREGAGPGIDAQIFTRARPLPDPAATLAGTTHLLLSIPPEAASDPALALHGADIARIEGLRWVGYLSTTGVYGDRGGAWVDEETPLAPSGERGARRAAAEEGWRALHDKRALPLHIFRLAGIYGPGRSAFDALRAGSATRIDKPGHVFSRIHVDDLAGVLRASMAAPAPGRVYNVCDDAPAAQAEIVAHASALLGIPAPPLVPFDDAPLGAMARSFYDDSKRVANRRMKIELGVRLRHPSYREGLAAILAAEAASNPLPSGERVG